MLTYERRTISYGDCIFRNVIDNKLLVPVSLQNPNFFHNPEQTEV